MKNLIIIGNGFDLHHGVKSSFNNFRSFLKQNEEVFLKNLEKYCINGTDLLWKEFELELGCLDIEEALESKIGNLVDYGDANWSDSYHYNYQRIVEEELEFGKQLKHYLKKWIKSVNEDVKTMYNKEFLNNNNHYITFNYTTLLTKLYQIDEDRVCYIHGNCNEDEDSLIIGHNNVNELETSEEDQKAIGDLDPRLLEADSLKRNFYKSTYKDVDLLISQQQGFLNKIKQINKIIIIGHSISYIDLPYFEYFKKLTNNKTKWIVSYYKENEKEELINKLMNIGVKEDRLYLKSTENIGEYLEEI